MSQAFLPAISTCSEELTRRFLRFFDEPQQQSSRQSQNEKAMVDAKRTITVRTNSVAVATQAISNCVPKGSFTLFWRSLKSNPTTELTNSVLSGFSNFRAIFPAAPKAESAAATIESEALFKRSVILGRDHHRERR